MSENDNNTILIEQDKTRHRAGRDCPVPCSKFYELNRDSCNIESPSSRSVRVATASANRSLLHMCGVRRPWIQPQRCRRCRSESPNGNLRQRPATAQRPCLRGSGDRNRKSHWNRRSLTKQSDVPRSAAAVEIEVKILTNSRSLL